MSRKNAPSVGTLERARRWLLIQFATMGREEKYWEEIRNSGKAASAVREHFRAVADEELRAEAENNLKGFDYTKPAKRPALDTLMGIDPEISSPDTPEEYFTAFRHKYPFQQTSILEKLIAASERDANIYDFTRDLFDCLRESSSLELSVHGKLQKKILRIKRPPVKRGKPVSAGNDLLRHLTNEVEQGFQIPRMTAAKLVRDVMRKVLVLVRDRNREVVRSRFTASDSTIKRIVIKQ